ncbi:MAG: hypothetical protein LDL55_11475, partial [Armatimonadetes bacterium]|nr:hypothetical protein [Armatimonadota bacterium]
MFALLTVLATSAPGIEWVEPPAKAGVPIVGRLVRTSPPDGSSQLHPTLRLAVKDPKRRARPAVPALCPEFRRAADK